MRVVHVAPRRPRTEGPFGTGILALARAQAALSRAPVRVVAAAENPQSARQDDLELKTFPTSVPAWLGCSRGLRHHLVNCPLELVHAHCPGQRGLHYAHLAAQRHGAPLVISPAGAFGYGKAEHVRPGCTLHRMITHPQALELANGWHASCAEEAAAIHAYGFNQPVCVAPPGIEIPSTSMLETYRKWWNQQLPQLAGRPVALCTDPLERSSRLPELISLWGDAFTGDWLLLIAGRAGRVSPEELRATAKRHGAAERVLIAQPTEAAPHAIARLFISSSRHTCDLGPVAAALAAGLPAIVAGEQPWSRLDAEQTGWCVPWPHFGPAIKTALVRGIDQLGSMGRNARDIARHEFDWPHAAETLLGFYRHLAA